MTVEDVMKPKDFLHSLMLSIIIIIAITISRLYTFSISIIDYYVAFIPSLN